MTDFPAPDAPEDTSELVNRIHARYRAAQPHARRVEVVHPADTAVPAELATHMRKDVGILLPAMRVTDAHGIKQPVAVRRAHNDDHGETVARIRALTTNLPQQPDTCGPWRALYSGTAKLLNVIAAHVRLKNDVLFSRFEPA